MRVQFEVTLDDFMDVSLRSFQRGNPIYSWWDGELYSITLLAGVAIYAASSLWVALIGGWLVLCLYPYFQRYQRNRRMRSLIRETVDTDSPVKVEVELLERGVLVKQLGTETLREWKIVSSIAETKDSIDFFVGNVLTMAVRKRAFSTDEEKDQFLTLARSLLEAYR